MESRPKRRPGIKALGICIVMLGWAFSPSAFCSSSQSSSRGGKGFANNPDFETVLRTWQGARFFTHIYVYKTQLPKTPNLVVTHHQGLVLTHEPVAGGDRSWIKVDFGKEGLKVSFWERFPEIENLLYWIYDQKYQMALLTPENGDPKNLIKALLEIKDWQYNVFNLNCQNFVEFMWEALVPDTSLY